MDEKFDEIFKLGALFELIDRCREIVQQEGFLGGHKGSLDSSLTDALNDVFEKLEELKAEVKLK